MKYMPYVPISGCTMSPERGPATETPAMNDLDSPSGRKSK